MNLKKRLPTALVLLGLLFLLIQFGTRPVIFLFLQALILAALMEFYNLARKKKLRPQRLLGAGLALVIGLSFYFRQVVPLDLALFAALFAAGVYYLFAFTRVEHLPFFTQSIAVTFFGAVYLGFTLNYLFLLKFERGPFTIYFLFSVIFLGDTGAYFLGKLFGRHRMAPLASPRKTWEGSVGGVLFGILGAWLAQTILLREVDLWRALLCGALVHAVAQMSDPLESLFKRAVGVKDSSNMLPGHGGFLDRIDSLILAAPFFYYLIKYLWP
ncbi:MAG: phosphatidate cytidylyltransferase [Candidatus Aminicenantes bacterium]|nr:phosphatidate cytidylyltransferase [Candidatus Aminicenantes bacterium]